MDIDSYGPQIRSLREDVDKIFMLLGRLGADTSADTLTPEQRIRKANGEDIEGEIEKPATVTRAEFEDLLDQIRQMNDRISQVGTVGTQFAAFQERFHPFVSGFEAARAPSTVDQVKDHIAETQGNQQDEARLREQMQRDQAARDAAGANHSVGANANGDIVGSAGTGGTVLQTRVNNGGLLLNNDPNPSGAREAMSAENQAPAGDSGVGLNGRPTVSGGSLPERAAAADSASAARSSGLGTDLTSSAAQNAQKAGKEAPVGVTGDGTAAAKPADEDGRTGRSD